MLKDEVITRDYDVETSQIKDHPMLLPKHLLKDLQFALHGTANKHPSISQLLQEFRQKY